MIPLLRNLFILTLKSPKEGASRFQSIQLTLNEIVMVAILFCILSSFIQYFQISFLGVGSDIEEGSSSLFTPINIVLFNLGSFVVLVLATLFGGKLFGGKGDFLTTLKLITWLQLVVFGIQIPVIVLELIIPFMSSILSSLIFVVYVILYCNFVVAIHNFQSAFKVFLSACFIFTILVMVLGTLVGGFLVSV